MRSDTGGTYVSPRTVPHPAFEPGTYFNPPTAMVRASALQLPEGSYTLDYRAPAADCP